LQVDVSRDIAQAERLYDQAKRILGITDSFQGQADSTAQSGKAKQIQVQQAAGRLDSKRQMKNAAYSEIDKIIFRYYLAYADEPRPAVYRDAEGKLQTESVPVDVNNHNATGEFADFYKTIAGDLSVSTPAIEGCKTVQAALAIVKSANMGGVPIKL
jgi:hypothetical protein